MARAQAREIRLLSDLSLTAALLVIACLGWWVSAVTAKDMKLAAMDGLTMVTPMPFMSFAIAWAAMMAAMMVPAILPVVRLYSRAAARGTVAPVFVFVAGYLLVWILVSVPAFAAWKLLLIPLENGSHWAARLAGAVAIVSALYQVTPLKTLCLRHCRSPMSFFLHHGKNLNRPWGAVQAGARHGVYCLGCCWLLMATLVALGTMQIGLMVVFAVLILLEKNAPFGERLARLSAAAFLIVGMALLLHPSSISLIL